MSQTTNPQHQAFPYRSDIDGLRAFAVVGVLVFHAGLNQLPGGFVGVDIFFVISGFLISGILWREFQSNGYVDFTRFWSRRFRRLMPMAVLVAMSTLVMASFFESRSRLEFTGKDALAAITYTSNWWEYFKGTDYFNDETTISLFRHFWSLAVEEQFYILTTLTFLFMTFFRKTDLSGRTRLISLVVLIAVVSATSFVLNLWLTNLSQPLGFFSTSSRVWQFSVGVLTMLITQRQRKLGVLFYSISAFLGFSIILFTFVAMAPSNSYPSWYAVAPTLGAGMIIFGNTAIAGHFQNPVKAFLSFAPIRFIGKISYSLYLWHWAIFISAHALIESNIVAALVGGTITLLLASLSYHLVENPLRTNNWLLAGRYRSISVAAITTSLLGSVALAFVFYGQSQSIIFLANGKSITRSEISNDIPVTYTTKPKCHIDQKQIAYPECVFGNSNSQKIIVLFGDSHAAHWFPAVELYAATNNFKLLSRTKSACGPMEMTTINSGFKRVYNECQEWRESVLSEIEKLRPNLVIVGSSKNHSPIGPDKLKTKGAERQKLLQEAVTKTSSRLASSASKVIFIEDTPWFEIQPIECASAGTPAIECSVSRNAATKGAFPWVPQTYVWPSNTRVVTLNDVLCPSNQCISYDTERFRFHDESHLTASYSQSLSKLLFSRIFH